MKRLKCLLARLLCALGLKKPSDFKCGPLPKAKILQMPKKRCKKGCKKGCKK